MDQDAVALAQESKELQQMPPVGIIPEELRPLQPTPENVMPAIRYPHP